MLLGHVTWSKNGLIKALNDDKQKVEDHTENKTEMKRCNGGSLRILDTAIDTAVYGKELMFLKKENNSSYRLNGR